MAKRGGYGRSEPVEWFKVPIQTYGEAIVSATNMGQEVGTWLIDAVNHHLYRCEALLTQQRYQMDEQAAAETGRPTPNKHDQRYAIQRPRPEITRRRNQPAESSSPGSRPRP